MARNNYYRLTPKQLSEGLNEAGVTMRQFCRFTGSDERRMQRWLDGDEPDIPPWVPLVLGLLHLPGAFAMAVAISDTMLIKDEKITNADD